MKNNVQDECVPISSAWLWIWRIIHCVVCALRAYRLHSFPTNAIISRRIASQEVMASLSAPTYKCARWRTKVEVRGIFQSNGQQEPRVKATFNFSSENIRKDRFCRFINTRLLIFFFFQELVFGIHSQQSVECSSKLFIDHTNCDIFGLLL